MVDIFNKQENWQYNIYQKEKVENIWEEMNSQCLVRAFQNKMSTHFLLRLENLFIENEENDRGLPQNWVFIGKGWRETEKMMSLLIRKQGWCLKSVKFNVARGRPE